MQWSSDIPCSIKMFPKIFPIINIQPEHAKLVIVYYSFYPKFLKSKLIESCPQINLQDSQWEPLQVLKLLRIYR